MKCILSLFTIGVILIGFMNAGIAASFTAEAIFQNPETDSEQTALILISGRHANINKCNKSLKNYISGVYSTCPQCQLFKSKCYYGFPKKYGEYISQRKPTTYPYIAYDNYRFITKRLSSGRYDYGQCRQVAKDLNKNLEPTIKAKCIEP
jgi:hypothetical protein